MKKKKGAHLGLVILVGLGANEVEDLGIKGILDELAVTPLEGIAELLEDGAKWGPVPLGHDGVLVLGQNLGHSLLDLLWSDDDSDTGGLLKGSNVGVSHDTPKVLVGGCNVVKKGGNDEQGE